MENKKWVLKNSNDDIVDKIASEANISKIVANILVNRGIDNSDKVSRFLNPDIQDLYDPYLFLDMDKCVDRIQKAISNKERILIYGDYDVDGVTSVTILLNFLKTLTDNVEYFVPDRFEDGYGITKNVLQKVKLIEPQLLITVDCGITAVKEVEVFNGWGIDVIITDHHECICDLPDAIAVINPKRKDNTYPFQGLAGVGVTFKLIQALCDRLSLGEKYLEFLDFTAIGTIADIVSLTDENRIIVKEGLKRFLYTKNVGLKVLLDFCKVTEDNLTSQTVGFILGPRINAAGRMGQANKAIELFTTDNLQLAHHLTVDLDRFNQERKAIQNEIYEEAIEKIEKNIDSKSNLINVVASKGWHHGVIGIVASKVTEKYYKPSILLSIEDGKAKGSIRSIPEIDILEVLENSAHLIERFGGHSMAAGIEVRVDNLVEFEKSMNKYAQTKISQKLIPSIDVDLELKANEISMTEILNLKKLEPFGQDNPVPLFSINGLIPIQVKGIGDGKHLKTVFMQNNKEYDSIAFNLGHLVDGIRSYEKVSILCSLEINSWNNREKIQFNIKDIKEDEEAYIKKMYLDTFFNYIAGLKYDLAGDLDNVNTVEYYSQNDLQKELELCVKEGRTVILSNMPQTSILIKDILQNISSIENDFELNYNNISIDSNVKVILLINPILNNIDFDKFDNVLCVGEFFEENIFSKLTLTNLKNKIKFIKLSSCLEDYSIINTDRNVVGSVYKYIKNLNLDEIKVSNMKEFSRDITKKTGVYINNFNLFYSIKVMEEIGIIDFENQGELLKFKVNEIATKVELTNSKLFNKLSNMV